MAPNYHPYIGVKKDLYAHIAHDYTNLLEWLMSSGNKFSHFSSQQAQIGQFAEE
jgi:hypothetical protein